MALTAPTACHHNGNAVQDDDYPSAHRKTRGKRSLREGMSFDACSATMRLAIRAGVSVARPQQIAGVAVER